MQLIPAALVDRLPASWWRPGNHYMVGGRSLHFCVNSDGVRTVEFEGREIGRGRAPFRFPPGSSAPA